MTLAIDTAQAGNKHNITGARQAYYDKISKYHLAPLWEVLKGLVTPEPKTQMQPALWKFPEIEKLMLEAGDVITAEEAERRVLVLENPGEPGKSRITNTLFAGIQLILPGEIADAHQHVASAIRFVLKGKGAYTAVEGEKAEMEHGDFIITANWAPHDHGNPGKEPVMWLDVLDMPTINHFQASFASHFDEKMQNVNHENGDSFERYATGVLPDGAPVHLNRSPVINYPYAKMRPILERLKSTGDIDQRHGARVRYANPINGGPVLPTIVTMPFAPFVLAVIVSVSGSTSVSLPSGALTALVVAWSSATVSPSSPATGGLLSATMSKVAGSLVSFGWTVTP